MQTSTTVPVVAAPCCQSMIAHVNIPVIREDGRRGVEKPQLLKIEQAAAARRHFLADLVGETAALMRQGRRRP